MEVKLIDCLDKDRNENFIHIVNKNIEIVCFSDIHPYKIGDHIDEILYCNFVENIHVAERRSYEIKPLINYPNSYQIIGKLINKQKGLVFSEPFIFEIDTDLLPGDIEELVYISFITGRIDI